MPMLQQAAATGQPGPAQAPAPAPGQPDPSQGAIPPAPPPAAPPPPGAGAADVTTAAGQADPNNMAPATSTAGAVGQLRAGQQGKNIGEADEEPTPEEQAAYEKAVENLHQVLYEDEERTAGFVQMLDPQDKIGSTVKTSVMLLKMMDEKSDLNENIVAELTVDIADRMIELGETAHDMSFSEKETQAVACATWEGVMQLFGMDE